MSMTIAELTLVRSAINYALTVATINKDTPHEAKLALSRAYVVVEREIKLRTTSPVTGKVMCPECQLSVGHSDICSQGRD